MTYTLRYVWEDENQISGYLLEVPGVCSQGKSLDSLKENIKEALELMLSVLKDEELKEPAVPGWENAELVEINL
jgi:predicted RNase H-like HicB family nuclease